MMNKNSKKSTGMILILLVTMFISSYSSSFVVEASTISEGNKITLQSDDNNWWQGLPIFPTLKESHHEIYQNGIIAGNKPTYFAVIGDCQTLVDEFMFPYYGMDEYSFSENSSDLIETLAFFKEDSIKYNTPGNMDGGSPAAHLSPGRPADWVDRGICYANESSIECEIRAYKPSIVFIRLGTHWSERAPIYYRLIVQKFLDANVLPILVTKAGNHEGDGSINAEIALIAQEFDVPLWNMWASMQELPNKGLDSTSVGGYMHLSEPGKEIQRFSALQILDTVWRYVR